MTIKHARPRGVRRPLLISLRVKASEKKSWFGFGADATVHVWGKPVLDPRSQVLRLTDIEARRNSQAAFGLLGAAARAAVPYLKDALAAQCAHRSQAVRRQCAEEHRGRARELPQERAGREVEATVTDLRLAGIEYDAKTLRIIAEAEGTLKIAISALPGR